MKTEYLTLQRNYRYFFQSDNNMHAKILWGINIIWKKYCLEFASKSIEWTVNGGHHKGYANLITVEVRQKQYNITLSCHFYKQQLKLSMKKSRKKFGSNIFYHT